MIMQVVKKFPELIALPNGASLEMVPIKAGEFMMGSPKNECGRFVWERRHKVTLTRDYWLGRYPVTQGQWKALVRTNPSLFNRGDDYPVEQVSWHDAKWFCDKLNKRFLGELPPGYLFDLPTEAQWEYACRAGTKTGLYNGKNLTAREGVCHNLDEVGWYRKNSAKSTHPVGLKKANAWGLYDMIGNVWEWCRDGFNETYWEDPEFLRDDDFDWDRVNRGGGYSDTPEYCRSACRLADFPDKRIGFLGFRLALVTFK